MDLSIINLIVYHINHANIQNVLIFNCWSARTTQTLSTIMANESIYSQFIDINALPIMLPIRNRPNLGVFLDFNCDSSKDAIPLFRFSQHYQWLIYDRWANISNFRRLLSQANLSIDSDLTYAVLNAEEEPQCSSIFTLFDVYSNGRHIGGRLNMTADREVICSANGCQVKRFLSSLHLRPKYDHRSQLTDVTIRVATVLTSGPLTLTEARKIEILHSTENRRVDSIARFGFQMLMILKDLLHCNMSYIFYDIWSKSEISGGSIGALVNQSVDLASTPFLITPARIKHVTPLVEISSFREVCMFRTPPNAAIESGVFLKPFDVSVWLYFGAFLILFAVLLWITFALEYTRMQKCVGMVPSILTTCLISFGSACIQSSWLIPSSTGGRVAFFSMSLVTFIMYNYYTSLVVSSLLGSPVKSSVKSLRDLADSSLNVGFQPLPYTWVFLNTSQLPVVRQLVKNKIESKKNVWISQEAGILRVRDSPGFVYVFEASPGFQIIEQYFEPHEICDLNEIELRPSMGLYTHLPKSSAYKELIRLKQLRMLEIGVYRKHHLYWVRTRLNCYANNYAIEVGLEYTAPLFLMLIFAYILSTVLLVMEILHKEYMHKKHSPVA